MLQSEIDIINSVFPKSDFKTVINGKSVRILNPSDDTYQDDCLIVLINSNEFIYILNF